MKAGIGLRTEHYQAVVDTQPDVGWFEIHSENYFGAGGKPRYYLEKIRQQYPISFHGVGLSLGSTDPLDFSHLNKLGKLINDFSPIFVSEHLSWSSVDGHYLNDLLPLPYTEEALEHMIERINQVQTHLKRTIFIENISSYLEFSHSTIPEYEFINEIAKRTGCGILLDVNNLYVNSKNHNWNAQTYLNNISGEHVQEIHLAGFTENALFIDTHDKPVAESVWELYAQSVRCLGTKPTLIEWDKNLPELSVLIQEAKKADAISA